MGEFSIIEVQDVRKHFKEVKAVDGISLDIKKGEYAALLGPNGAGKTTLVEMIEGIQIPDSGDIRIKGLSWKGNDEKLHRMIGLSLQETRFFDKLTVFETLKLFSSFYKLSNDRINHILGLINLEYKRKTFVKKLSGGQRQRLALGIAFLNQPEILLLDEPTTGLDPTARREVWDILIQLQQDLQTTMILTTHYMEEASYLCKRIIIVDHGKVLAKGTLDELLKEHNSGEVINFSLDRPIDKDILPEHDIVLKKEMKQDGLSGEVIVKDLVHYLPLMLNAIEGKEIQLTSLECRKMTLDDLFIAMTGRHLNE